MEYITAKIYILKIQVYCNWRS